MFLPHYQGWFKFDESDVKLEAQRNQYPVYALSDQAALKVVGTSSDIEIDTIGVNYIIAPSVIS